MLLASLPRTPFPFHVWLGFAFELHTFMLRYQFNADVGFFFSSSRQFGVLSAIESLRFIIKKLLLSPALAKGKHNADDRNEINGDVEGSRCG